MIPSSLIVRNWVDVYIWRSSKDIQRIMILMLWLTVDRAWVWLVSYISLATAIVHSIAEISVETDNANR